MEHNYLPRVVDKKIKEMLTISGGILIAGPRDVGKTETGIHFSNSCILLGNTKELDKVKLNTEEALKGKTPHLIDEWQFLPSLFNDIKQEIDSRRQFGQFILSGSSAPDDDITMHSGAGRISKIFLRPMSLFESGNSSNEVNFVSLFKSKCKISGTQKCNLEFYVDKILRGGWPRYINLKGQKVKSVIRKYVENIVDIDMRKLKSPPDSMRMYELTKALARNVATQAAIKTLSREAETGSIDKKNNEYGDKTTRKYLDQLSQVYVLEELQAWKTHARSSVRLLEKSKWYFIDPSIATAILDMSYEKLMNDKNYFGFIFESLAIRDLRIYADAIDGVVYFFKDSNGFDVDAIIELPDGSWSAFEIKLGSTEGIEQGAATLKNLKNKVDEKKMKLLKSLNVVTTNTGSYTRSDGINIIELANLFI